MKAGTLNFHNHAENHGVKSNNCNIFTKPTCTKSKINTFKITVLSTLTQFSTSQPYQQHGKFIKDIYHYQSHSFKINLSFSFILQHCETLEYRYRYASNNEQLRKSPHLIYNQLDLQNQSKSFSCERCSRKS